MTRASVLTAAAADSSPLRTARNPHPDHTPGTDAAQAIRTMTRRSANELVAHFFENPFTPSARRCSAIQAMVRAVPGGIGRSDLRRHAAARGGDGFTGPAGANRGRGGD